MKKPELLAPAGDMDCFYAAINAGADAIYLGGNEYGARAYASNFSTEELIEAISYAHLYGVRVYLTVNTLVKEREFDHLVDFLTPIYNAGLDGVIIQDLGVFMEIKEHFPGIELHGSTQMCIASKYGAMKLKELGACRVVPARELSLEEIIEIKKETGLELETFIHGAMCYCYSGQCLFSSFLGGRSGNRGRCAGPCRLPYDHDVYPLSLKDMCTVSILPDLIDAGIDSFKIEGRMKNPYYVAGVTAIYRKYIDLYCAHKLNRQNFHIEKKDMELLKKLYIRSELLDGYYHRHNGKEMITMSKPGYSTSDASDFAFIKSEYLDQNRKISLSLDISLTVNEPIYMEINIDDQDLKKHINTIYFVSDFVVSEALKKPLSEEGVRKQLLKTGNSAFNFSDISVIMNGNCFLSLKDLNECRRNALEEVKKSILNYYSNHYFKLNYDGRAALTANLDTKHNTESSDYKQSKQNVNSNQFHISVMNEEQFVCICEMLEEDAIANSIHGLCLDWELLLDHGFVELFQSKYESIHSKVKLFVTLPYVGRERAMDLLDQISDKLFVKLFDGYYCNQLDDYSYISNRLKKAKLETGIETEKKEICGDAGLYLWNHKANEAYKNMNIKRNVVALELSHFEYEDIVKACTKKQLPYEFEYVVYGRIPFMQTANCYKKTNGRCDGRKELSYIKDRYGKKLPIINRCSICENTIYNSVPLSLIEEMDAVTSDYYRLNFTTENEIEVKKILNAFIKKKEMPLNEYTKGHFKKGIQ